MDEKAKDFVSEIELNFSKSLLVKTTLKWLCVE